jgi:hypothetical protein
MFKSFGLTTGYNRKRKTTYFEKKKVKLDNTINNKISKFKQDMEKAKKEEEIKYFQEKIIILESRYSSVPVFFENILISVVSVCRQPQNHRVKGLR